MCIYLVCDQCLRRRHAAELRAESSAQARPVLVAAYESVQSETILALCRSIIPELTLTSTEFLGRVKRIDQIRLLHALFDKVDAMSGRSTAVPAENAGFERHI